MGSWLFFYLQKKFTGDEQTIRNKNAFEEQNEISKPAVAAIKSSLEGWGHWVTDTQNDPEWWEKDIDLIVDLSKYVEVKFDTRMHKTGNLFVENISCVENSSLGWFQKTQCDELHYVEYRSNNELSICHSFSMDELREYVESEKPNLIKSWDYQDKKTKSAYLVPLADVKKFKSYDSFLLQVNI